MKDLSNKIKEFEKIIKVPYVKRIPKHEPTSSYFHLVVCIAECMMICGEKNHNVHGVHDGYEEEMASSSDVNDTDEDKSKHSIVNFSQTFTGEYIYGRKQIRMQNCQQNFIAEQFIRRTD